MHINSFALLGLAFVIPILAGLVLFLPPIGVPVTIAFLVIAGARRRATRRRIEHLLAVRRNTYGF